MISVLNTILPVFAVILLGLVVRRTGYLPGELAGPLNRLVFYIAIPAMIFKAIVDAPFGAHFNPILLITTCLASFGIFLSALLWGRVFAVPREEMGTFAQSSFHGNLGYIGLAVAYYALGREGLARASLVAGFLVLLQNFLAVVSLMIFARRDRGRRGLVFLAKKVVANPIIIAALAAILWSVAGIPMPVVLNRFLGIVSGMALPLALLVIGASLSTGLMRSYLRFSLSSASLKLLGLPLLGLVLYRAAGLGHETFLPGLILLASPTATVTYVMAAEMGGSQEQASASVSTNTLLSCATFIFWLVLFM